MAQLLKCFPGKLVDQHLDPQGISKCLVTMVAHVEFQPRKVEAGDLQSKLASETLGLIERP